MTKDIEKWWDTVAEDYQKGADIGVKSAHYGPFAPDENELRLLGNVKGKRILEIGCGGGQCSIAFAKQGAICTGVDQSEEQLKYAKALAKKNKVKVKFVKSDIQILKGFESKAYDIVFSAYALQFIPDLGKNFKEVNRVLKKGGLFVFSFGNPFHTMLRFDTSYNKPGKIVLKDAWKDGAKFVMYNRKISGIFDDLMAAGFILERIIEPYKAKGQSAWRKGSWKEIYPKKLVEKVSPTIIFKAKKK